MSGGGGRDVRTRIYTCTYSPYLESLFPRGARLRLGQRRHPDLLSNGDNEVRVFDEHSPPPSVWYAIVLNDIGWFELCERGD